VVPNIKRILSSLSARALSRGAGLGLAFLLVELLDEMAYGLEAPATPAIRAELGLTYAEVGLLLGLPGLVNAFLEPVVLLLGDGPWRPRLVVGGGLLLGGALLATAAAQDLSLLVAAAMIAYPASGAFVTLSQASLIEASPGREAPVMARWTAAGSLGALLGPAVMAASLVLGRGWRPPYVLLGGCVVLLALLSPSRPLPAGHRREAGPRSPARSLTRAIGLARDAGMRRWIFLLQVSDLMLDILAAYAGLYLVGVVGFEPAAAAVILGGMTASGLLSDLAAVWVLDRYPGRGVLRIGAIFVASLYPLLLATPWAGMKVGLLLLIRFLTLGWYPVLQGEAYASANGDSGAMLALSSVAGVMGSVFAWLIGWLAESIGLQAAMWLLLLGPVCLILFLPGPKEGTPSFADRSASGSRD
jgi:FSR family fosmidomycin resistance protein-like MFS transporter